MPTGEFSDRLWRRYEESVKNLIAAMDPSVEVAHDVVLHGGLSGVRRQVDVLVQGTIAGLDITVAVECKRHRRRADIGLVDQFVGKILDIGADRGILYSYSGFTDSAVMRAVGARNPFVLAVAVDTPESLRDSQAPGFPQDLLVQECAPQWIEELGCDNFKRFLLEGEWSKFWS